MSEEKKPSLFRKKSEEYIDSPEKLDHYLHVTNPGVWALLLAVFFLLIGFCVWGNMGELQTHVSIAIVCENGKSVAYVPESAVKAVVDTREVDVEGKSFTLSPNAMIPMSITDSTNIYIRMAGSLSVGDIVYEIPMEGSLEDGVYSGDVVTETVTPMSLLLN